MIHRGGHGRAGENDWCAGDLWSPSQADPSSISVLDTYLSDGARAIDCSDFAGAPERPLSQRLICDESPGLDYTLATWLRVGVRWLHYGRWVRHWNRGRGR